MLGRGVFAPELQRLPFAPETRMVADEIELLDRENALLELERIVARVRDHGQHELHVWNLTRRKSSGRETFASGQARSPPSAANVEAAM